jgi:hypothetical protein
MMALSQAGQPLIHILPEGGNLPQKIKISKNTGLLGTIKTLAALKRLVNSSPFCIPLAFLTFLLAACHPTPSLSDSTHIFLTSKPLVFLFKFYGLLQSTADCPSRYWLPCISQSFSPTPVLQFQTSHLQFHPNLVFSVSPHMSLAFFHLQYRPKVLLTPTFIFPACPIHSPSYGICAILSTSLILQPPVLSAYIILSLFQAAHSSWNNLKMEAVSSFKMISPI